jgi:hypothetical protein
MRLLHNQVGSSTALCMTRAGERRKYVGRFPLTGRRLRRKNLRHGRGSGGNSGAAAVNRSSLPRATHTKRRTDNTGIREHEIDNRARTLESLEGTS